MNARRPVAIALAAAVLASLALAGCSSSDSAAPSSGSAPNADSAMDAGGKAGEAYAAPSAAPQPTGTQPAASRAETSVEQRALIYTGTITIQVSGVAASADRAIAIATAAGGFVGGDNRTIDAQWSQATLILRIPADRFSSTLDALAAIGVEQSRLIQSQDVTDTLVDLDAHIATQQASVDRVRQLLARAQTIGEIVTLENELTRRQAELDSLLQRRAKYAGLVALATITVVLRGPAAVVGPTEPDTGFVAGLRDGWRGFLASVKVVLTVAGWLLPWAIAIGVPATIVLWLRRRTRRSRAALASAPPAPSSADATD